MTFPSALLPQALSLLAAAAPHAHTGARRGVHHHGPMPRWLLHLGMPGLFFISLLDGSPIPLAIPGSTDLLLLLLVVQRGSHPFWLAIVATLGSIIGGYITWSAGKKGGEAMFDRWVPKRLVRPITGWVKERGGVAVAVSTILPPPVPLTPLLLGAGAFGVSRRKFFLAFSIARALRYGLVAWIGVAYGRRVLRWWNLYLADFSKPVLWSFFALLIAGLLFGFWRYKHLETPGKRLPQPAVS